MAQLRRNLHSNESPAEPGQMTFSAAAGTPLTTNPATPGIVVTP
jgi:hypothetical protein